MLMHWVYSNLQISPDISLKGFVFTRLNQFRLVQPMISCMKVTFIHYDTKFKVEFCGGLQNKSSGTKLFLASLHTKYSNMLESPSKYISLQLVSFDKQKYVEHVDFILCQSILCYLC